MQNILQKIILYVKSDRWGTFQSENEYFDLIRKHSWCKSTAAVEPIIVLNGV